MLGRILPHEVWVLDYPFEICPLEEQGHHDTNLCHSILYMHSLHKNGSKLSSPERSNMLVITACDSAVHQPF